LNAPPTYETWMGYVDYEVSGGGRDVVIAGQIRKGIRYCNPTVEAAYLHADHVATTKPLTVEQLEPAAEEALAA